MTAALAFLTTGATLLSTPPTLDVHPGRIVAAFLLCSLLALAVALFVRRYGPMRMAPMFKTPGRAIRVIESQPLSAHASICRLSFDGREYVVVVGQSAATLLGKPRRRRPCPVSMTPITDRARTIAVPALAALAFAFLVGDSAAATAANAAESTPSVAANDLIRNAVLLTALSLGPVIFISMTSFVRIAVVLAMVRHAFGMPETPPNTVLVSLAVLLTAFVMGPTFSNISTNAVEPFMKGEIGVDAALANGAAPLKQFMLRQVRREDLAAIYHIARTPLPQSAAEVDILKLTPAFILNELRASFTIGFVILLPFLLIEIVVASILLALGMMMVPPSTISLPIKILMFVLIDGWSLVIEGVVGGFR